MNPHNNILSSLGGTIEKGLQYLSQNQLQTGEFKSYRSTDPLMKEDCVFDSSPFPNALITFSLSFSDSCVAKKMIEQSFKFLLSEMETHGVWRYWTAQHPYHKSIPPDLDDIACISSILQQNDISFPNNRELVLANRNSNGLFYTWIVPRIRLKNSLTYLKVVLKEALKPLRLYYFWKHNESEPDDIDAVVNSNVLFYLGSSAETKPIIDYLIDIVSKNKEEGCDKWHLSPLNLQYFLSRNYLAGIFEFETIRSQSINKLLATAYTAMKVKNNVLEIALATCALLNWNCPADMIQPYIEEILNHQSHSGSWPIFPLYYGGPKKYFGWGSEEITTGYCLEALTRYLKIVQNRCN